MINYGYKLRIAVIVSANSGKRKVLEEVADMLHKNFPRELDYEVRSHRTADSIAVRETVAPVSGDTIDLPDVVSKLIAAGVTRRDIAANIGRSSSLISKWTTRAEVTTAEETVRRLEAYASTVLGRAIVLNPQVIGIGTGAYCRVYVGDASPE